MKEWKAMITAYNKAILDGKRAALATVIKVEGSAYRRPGARMLVSEDGEAIGTVSGGCLERDVIEQCIDALNTGECRRLKYDTSHDDDQVIGWGSGCSGSVHIFVEVLDGDSLWPGCGPINGRVEQEFVQATVISSSQSSELPAGTKFRILRAGAGMAEPTHSRIDEPDAEALLPIADPELNAALAQEAQKLWQSRKPRLRSCELRGVAVEVFFELAAASPSLLIFGAGYDAPPVAELAYTVGMQVSVYDHRKAFANHARFPEAERVVHYKPEDCQSWPEILSNSYCVVMSHNFLVDKIVLAGLLQSNCKYIGVLGPKLRTNKLLEQLELEGLLSSVTESRLLQVHAPIGLDIGAETPEQIALAVIAEIQSVISGRQPGFLKERALPIHEPQDSSTEKTVAIQEEQDLPGFILLQEHGKRKSRLHSKPDSHGQQGGHCQQDSQTERHTQKEFKCRK